MKSTGFRSKVLFGSLLLALPLLFIADLIFGSVYIPAQEVISILFGNESNNYAHEIIVLHSRLPKALTATICGAALSLSGLQMQALFRNPLAGPYILGISNGAGLGVALLVMAGSLFGFSITGSIGITFAAMLGAALTLAVIFFFSIRIKDIMTVLIVGIMLGSVATAFIGIIQYVSTAASLKSFLIWSMGSLEGLNYNEISLFAAFFAVGSILMFSQLKNLNLLLLGETYAKGLGLKITSTRLLVILSTSFLAGSATAFCGPIGFVGIVVPHICRVIFNSSNHFVLFPASCLMGVNILLFSDIVSHLPGHDMVLPINSITSIIGIPVILWMILGKKSIAKAF